MGFIENISSIPITDFAEKIGYTVVRKGNKYYSLKEHDSVIIDTSKNCFWRNSVFTMGHKGGAGGIIDFAIEFNGASDVKEAVKQIASIYGIEGDKKPKVEFKKTPAVKPKERKVGDITFPKRDDNTRNVYGYLHKTRAINEVVIDYFLENNMLYQDTYKNCVFHTGKVFGCLRSSNTYKKFVMDLEGCDYNECFFFKGKETASTLVVAESVIDIMSIMTQFLKEKKLITDYCYLALSGTNKLESVFYHIKKEKENGSPIKYILIGTDNDEAGEKASSKILEGAKNHKVMARRYAPPKGKDWNEYIVLQRDSKSNKER